MIHVRMREENDIERRQLARPESRSDVALGSERQGANADANASLQRWIREDPDTKKVEQHRCVTEPRKCQLIVSPMPWIGFVGRRRDGSEISLADTSHILEIGERNLHLQVAELSSPYDARCGADVPGHFWFIT
jgi:hypothetical protein